MTIHDEQSEYTVAPGLVATLSGVTPAKGNIVDTAGYGAVFFAAMTGTVTDAGTTAGFTVKLQESATTADADFTDVASPDYTGNLTVTSDTDDNVAVGKIGYVGNHRYVRVVATGTTGTDATVAVVALLGEANYQPATDTADKIAAT